MVYDPSSVADANKRVYSLPDTDVSTNETGVALPVEITYADFPEFFDETAFDPSTIDTALWLDASDSDTITIDTGVSEWADKSGNGNDFVQTTGTDQPTVQSAAVNGLDALRFDGSDDNLSNATLQLSLREQSIFVVFRENSAVANAGVLCYKGTSNDYDSTDGQVFGTGDHSSNRFTSLRLTGTDMELYLTPSASTACALGIYNQIETDPNDAELFVDGTSVYTDTSYNQPAVQSLGGVVIGARWAAGGIGGPYLNGDVCEIIQINSAVSLETRQKIEGYLAHKWGLTSSLPSTHPWKSKAPPEYLKISAEQDGSQLPIEVSPNEWELKVDSVDSSLIIRPNGIDGSTIFTDESANDHTITTTGVTNDDGQIKFQDTAILFESSNSDYLQVTEASELAPGSGDFWLEFWVYLNTRSGIVGFFSGSSSSEMWIALTTEGWFGIGQSSWDAYYTAALSTGSWHHLALGRSSGTGYWYQNGTRTKTAGLSKTYAVTDPYIGRTYGGSYLDGYIDELIYKVGVCDHTEASFQVPSSPYNSKKAVLYIPVDADTATGAEVTISADGTQDDNTTYVGVTGSAVAQSVYDSNFFAVYHMAQDPSGGADCILDSTSNENHGTPGSAMVSGDLVDGNMGKALDFSGAANSYVNIPNNILTVDGSADFTLLAHVYNRDDSSNEYFTICLRGSTNGDWKFGNKSDGTFIFEAYGGGSTRTTAATNTKDTWQTFVGRYDSTNGLELFKDGTSTDTEPWTGTPGGVTGTDGLGGSYSGYVQYTDCLLGEVRLISSTPSDTQVNLISKAFLGTLWTVSAYGGGGVARLQYWDEDYANAIVANLQYWDVSYALLNYIIAYVDEVYGVQLQKYWNLPYGNNPIKTVFFDLLYGDNPILVKYFDLPYGDRQAIIKYWEEKYGINRGISQYWEERYTLSAKDLVAYFDLNFDIKNTNDLLAYFDEYYSINADSVVEAGTVTFTIGGVVYNDPILASFELNKDRYYNVGELQFAHPEPYLAATEGTELRITDTDIDLYLEVTIPTKRETTKETTYTIPAESKTRILERSNVINEEFGETTAKTVCTTVAARYGITIDWQILDWPLPADVAKATDETPYQFIHKITSEAGAILQTTFAGDTLEVKKAMESDSNQWDIDTPSYTLVDNLHFISTNQSASKRPGYNKYRATDQAESDEIRTYLEDDEYAVAKRIVKCFRVPWDGTARSLKTSDNNATIQYLNIVTEEIEEAVSIINGEGESRLQKPFYGRVSHSYNDTNLGTPTVTEEGVVQTPTAGQSLLTLTYTTKYYKWLVTDYDDPEIQIWVE